MMTYRKFLERLSAVAALWLTALCASASPWPFAAEISVAEAYNRLYATDYDENTFAGLQALSSDHGLGMQTLWSLDDFAFLEMLVFDTSSTAGFGIQIAGGAFYQLYTPGPWTSPTRGWLPDTRPGLIDLAAVFVTNNIATNAQFSLRVGGTVLTSSNTYRFETPLADQWLFALNDNGGLLAGDKDANEPIVCAFNTVSCTQALSVMNIPLPGSLGLALLGLVLLQRTRCSPKRAAAELGSTG